MTEKQDLIEAIKSKLEMICQSLGENEARLDDAIRLVDRLENL